MRSKRRWELDFFVTWGRSSAGKLQTEQSEEGLSERDFDRFSRLIYSVCGIRLLPHKKTMLEVRLRKRLRILGMQTYGEYGDYVFSVKGMQQELSCLIDEVTTNKTDFFREPAHFDFLLQSALPQLYHSGAGRGRPLIVWSAGCSSGEEPYTIGMILSEFADTAPGCRFIVLGTDISNKVLEKARLGVYPLERAEPIPHRLKKKYLLRSRDPEKNQVRIAPELRTRVLFRHLNFMTDEPADAIFCRNVIIYFDRQTQEGLLGRLCSHLRPNGFLFMGHSETLNGMNLPLIQVAPAVYRKRSGEPR
jgi:chemotaxis protein methyltransferase CheR